MKEKIDILSVYKRMMEQARVYRDSMKKYLEEGKKIEADKLAELSSELTYWCGVLENTEEVNPTINN